MSDNLQSTLIDTDSGNHFDVSGNPSSILKSSENPSGLSNNNSSPIMKSSSNGDIRSKSDSVFKKLNTLEKSDGGGEIASSSSRVKVDRQMEMALEILENRMAKLVKNAADQNTKLLSELEKKKQYRSYLLGLKTERESSKQEKEQLQQNYHQLQSAKIEVAQKLEEADQRLKDAKLKNRDAFIRKQMKINALQEKLHRTVRNKPNGNITSCIVLKYRTKEIEFCSKCDMEMLRYGVDPEIPGTTLEEIEGATKLAKIRKAEYEKSGRFRQLIGTEGNQHKRNVGLKSVVQHV